MKRRAAIALCVFFGGLAAILASASVDRCGRWALKPPALQHLARGQGGLQTGAAKVKLEPVFPTVPGGYGPMRHTVDRTVAPLFARALVLDVGGQRLGLVLLDVLLIPPQLRDAIGQGQAFPVWVVATHTHSGPSGFDPRMAAELAALGSFRVDDSMVLVNAARQALAQATAAARPTKLELGEAMVEGVSTARSGTEVDRRLTRLRFDASDGPVAQLIIVSAHPTLIARRPEGLHPDWPGLLAAALEEKAGPVTFVLQGAGGNASVDRANLPDPEAVAARLKDVVQGATTHAQPEPVDAAWTEVHVWLPRPEALRLAPGPLRPAAENALCDDAEDIAVLHGLKLGEARLLLVPFEPSFVAGKVLEEEADATRLVSLADGYGGYVETVEVVRAGQGESARQYFPADLLTRLAEGAQLAGQGLK